MVSAERRYALLDRALATEAIPDAVLRAGSRLATRKRLRNEERGGGEAREERLRKLVERMSSGPIAELPAKANEQHYELPPEFLGLFLGPRRKYSGCLWPPGVSNLAGAEEAMLRLTCERAGIEDGMDVLDLGCGWGALSLWIAEKYPRTNVSAISNSHRQRAWIESERARRGLGGNLEIFTADVNEFAPGDPSRFDRVVSVEMFEHMRNWSALLARIADWLKPGGKAFVHVFSHRRLAYRFEGTWAAARFFTAGTMPSHDLIRHFPDDMVVTRSWAVPGWHYAKTLEAWLRNLEQRAPDALRILTAATSAEEGKRLLATWRLFLISTAEIWAWRGGNEWMVSHYLLEPRGGRGRKPLVRDTYSA